MKIITHLPMKYDISKPGVHSFKKQNIRKIIVPQTAKSTSILKTNAANPALTPEMKQALRIEITCHRDSADGTAKSIAKLRTWQNGMNGPMVVAAVGIGSLVLFALVFPVSFTAGSGISVSSSPLTVASGDGSFICLTLALIWYGVFLVCGSGALLVAAGLFSGILVTASVASACLQLAIRQQRKKLSGSRAYADVLAAKIISDSDADKQTLLNSPALRAGGPR